MHLSAQEKQEINGLVAEVEATSGAQFIVAVIGKADAYPEIPWKAFALASACGALVVAAAEFGIASGVSARIPGFSAPSLLLALGAGLMAALLAIFMPAVGRLLLDGERARMELDQYARALFLERGMFETRRRTGILILIGLFEGAVTIVADRGVRRHASAEQIEAIASQLAPLVKRGRAAEAARSALTALAQLLGAKLGPATDGNELAEALVEARGS